ncbi:hypothetical protein DH2020_024806 [Rehmannia glutinosa]|uniref:Bifunctional inhibitor/plant lipid transfer protein/seed storage helical domain-containing protein n=1 Tax=Rehmannia glutinosa TaxID=99300 RepID=A0ABR0W452_REHGL
MAYKAILFLALLSVLSTKTTAQSSCTNTLMGLSPCLNYVTGNSSSPSSSCCSQLSNVVQSQPQCLCLLMNGAASSYGININQTLALALPGVCNVQTPPLSRCNGMNTGNGPTASPANPQSPPADSSNAPETNPSGSDIPSEQVDARLNAGSKTVIGGSNVQAPSNVVILVLFVASYALFVAGF